MVFNLDFANDLILSFLFLFFLFTDLIPAFTAQNFNQIAELIVPVGIPTKEAKAEMETDPVIAEIQIRQ